MYYRILNPIEEPDGQILTSNRRSLFREEVFAYRKLSFDIYNFALKSGIRIYNAVRVAENVPMFLDELNEFFKSSATEYDLKQMLVDDPIRKVSSSDLYNFSCNYITHIDETGLYYDWGHEHYLWEFIWEMVRYYEYPDKPSRMDSVFLFDNIENANAFKNQYRDSFCKIVEINLLEGEHQSFDMNWFTDVPSDITLAQVKDYSRNYWESKMTKNPIVEVLHKGTYMWNSYCKKP